MDIQPIPIRDHAIRWVNGTVLGINYPETDYELLVRCVANINLELDQPGDIFDLGDFLANRNLSVKYHQETQVAIERTYMTARLKLDCRTFESARHEGAFMLRQLITDWQASRA